MRSLYESILDTDQELDKQLEELVAPVTILKIFKKIFGKLEKTKKTQSISYLGSISEDVISRKNVQTASKEIVKKIGEFRRELKKIGADCKLSKAKNSSYANIVFVTWNLLVEYPNPIYGKNFYGIGILASGYNSNEVEVEDIMVNSSNDDIIRAAESINLYESILDDDKTISDRIEDTLLTGVIIDKLKKYFNKDLERMSKVKRVGQWYPIGIVDSDLYDDHDIKKTEKFMINAIKYWHLDIKKIIPHTLIDIDPEVDKFGETYTKRYRVKLINAEKEYFIDFVISATKTPYDEEIRYIQIWTKNQELADLI